ncbi:MAG TPA: class I tRNA ligase family protein [Solirubrobacterales bacterium]|jgi:leucyl-tRNA synthetase|nr:class I tRNA ligase family protein [Solirubrobacterales bacterium]
MSGKPQYDAQRIEASRQAVWAERGELEAPQPPRDGQRAVYVKASSPFTSGNLHMGHVRDYAIGDAYARFQRARGDAVLFGFGFDAFGLPAELAAIERQVLPAEWVRQCGERMLEQMKRLGFSFDYDRVFYSSDEGQYRWTQWLFLTLLEIGMIYRADATVDWCDTCQTTLASIQVEEGGTCWRCHNEVRLIRRPTWFLKITDYLEENDANSEQLRNWDELSLATQRYILGRTDGVELELEGSAGKLTVFSPHRGALAAARFVLLSPRHPEIETWAASAEAREELEQMRSGGWERSARDARAVPVLDTGTALSGLDGSELPVLVSPLVDARYGPTAAFGIPAIDEADAEIAARIARVEWGREDDRQADPGEKAATGEGAGAQPAGAREAKRYRANDFSISRQRAWGTPIPIVHCGACGAVPVPVEDLPVVLPSDLMPRAEGNPLAERPDFVDVDCPRCGGAAKRETDTLDCHFDALFLWIPAAVPPADRAEQMFTHPHLRHWLPAERLVAGNDSGGFVFDQRIVTKALRDHGELAFMPDGEPFAGCLFHEMVIAEGRKMSKHLGNVIDPDELVSQHGADTVRLAVLYAAGPAKTLNWSEGAVRFANRFLRNLWTYSHDRFAALEGYAHDEEAAADTEHLRDRLRKWCENGLARITEDAAALQMHKAIRDLTRLFERIQDFEKRVVKRRGQLGRADAEAQIAALVLTARALAPFAPHTAEELLLASGVEERDLPGPWPDSAAIPVAAGSPAAAS